ncbi:hypothetical protein D3C80_903190 [compost metagenome]
MGTRILLCMGLSGALAAAAPVARAQVTPSPISPVAVPSGAPIPTGAPLELKLDEAVALALRNNRVIRSAYLQRVVQRFDLRVAERAFVPQGGIGLAVAQRRHDGETEGETVISPSATWRTPLGGSVSFVWARSDPQGDGAGS